MNDDIRSIDGYIEATLTLRRAEDGGRPVPIRSGYRPNWWLSGEAGDIWAGGTVQLLEGDTLEPGTTAPIRIYPFTLIEWVALSPGATVEMCEGPVLVGRATITRVVSAVEPVAV